MKAFGLCPRLLGVLLLCGLTAGSTNAAAQEVAGSRVDPDHVQLHEPIIPFLWRDIRHVLGQPLHWEAEQWVLFGASALTLAAVAPKDEEWSVWAHEEGPDLGALGTIAGYFGDSRSFVFVGAFWVGGVFTGDQQAQNASQDMLTASCISAGLINAIGATVVGRDRPSANAGAFSFRPFRGRSFPSGHVANTFGVLAALATTYDDKAWVSVLAYGMGTIAAYMRVHRYSHWVTDSIAGAILGTAVGRAVVIYNRKQRAERGQVLGAPVPQSTTASASPPVYGALPAVWQHGPERGGTRISISPLLGMGTYGLSGSISLP